MVQGSQLDISSVFVLVVGDLLQDLTLQSVERVTELGLKVSVTCSVSDDLVLELSYPSA